MKRHYPLSALKRLRQARTLSQTELAELAGISQESVSKAERGLRRLSPEVQTRIATLLGSSRLELFPESAEVIQS